MPLDKSYDPAATETRLYEQWEKTGAFACDVMSSSKPYTIMMPPPNVTGSLHMGHALTFTLQDILIRFQRMRGKDALWQPGTDHAGIATQMVVERQLAAAGSPARREMGRDAFLKKVWKWKAESGGTITRQLRRLGASCDWSRERFTMEDDLNKGVTRAFVTMYREKLIFKDKRLVNWDPKMLTAVSDLEVEQKEVKGHMWHFRYPLEAQPGEFICVATTRPETMLGDGAVAVNPNDERYKHLVGTYAMLPLANRRIPIIADEHADPEKGSGAVKITAAHDFNDFEVWKRHRHQPYFLNQQDGGLINLFDQHAAMNDNAPEAFRGLDRYAARKKVIADLEALDLIEKIENITHVVPHGDRSGVVIEPWLSEQWYCDAKTLAEPAIKAVEEGHTVFEPKQWTNTYYSWMRNIEPWCISRQLWWGHQIPAWYGFELEKGAATISSFSQDRLKSRKIKTFVAETKEEALQLAKTYMQENGWQSEPKIVENDQQAINLFDEKRDQMYPEYGIWRDEDVLDTWFSSALWPFSTLGWPEKTKELERYYPTDVLVTGFDIIFFWVARMMMMGLYFMKDVPFRTVYIHALVRDEKGQKMSKTKGNVIDPLDVIDKFGCDALRFTLANMSTPGRDIRLATSRIEGNRNFATKLWNATRFCQMNGCAWEMAFNPINVTQTVNKWIVGETKLAADKVASLLLDHRFDLSSAAAYDFCWNIFCDWYVEFTKPILAGNDEAAKAETKATTAWALGQMLHILHPFMPYITEELWAQFVQAKEMLIKQVWPVLHSNLVDKDAKTEMDWVIALIGSIRTVRAELNVPAGAQVPLQVKDASDASKARLVRHEALVMRLARLSGITHVTALPKGSAQTVLGEATFILPLADIIDLEQERGRLRKEAERLSGEIKKLEGKLGNKEFVDRAPPEIVEEQRERKAEAEAMLAKLAAAEKSLSA